MRTLCSALSLLVLAGLAVQGVQQATPAVQYAIEPAPSAHYFYVDNVHGSDSNDCLSRGSACFSISHAESLCTTNSGGICTIDSSQMGSATFSSEIDIGNSSNTLYVRWIPPVAAVWLFNITDGVSCGIKIFGKTSVLGTDTPGGNAIFYAAPASSSVNMHALTCTDEASSGQYVNIKGISAINMVGAALSRGAIEITHLYDNSRIQDVLATNTNGVGLKFYDVCCGTTVDNSEGSGGGATGGRPVVIGDSILGGAVEAGGVINTGFYDLSAVNPGPGYPAIAFGDTTGFTGNLVFSNVHIEQPVSTAPGIELGCNVWGVVVNGLSFTNTPPGQSPFAIDVPSCANPFDAFFSGVKSQTHNNIYNRNTGTLVGGGNFGQAPPYSTNGYLGP